MTVKYLKDSFDENLIIKHEYLKKKAIRFWYQSKHIYASENPTKTACSSTTTPTNATIATCPNNKT
jgi:hypothetical protein